MALGSRAAFAPPFCPVARFTRGSSSSLSELLPELPLLLSPLLLPLLLLLLLGLGRFAGVADLLAFFGGADFLVTLVRFAAGAFCFFATGRASSSESSEATRFFAFLTGAAFFLAPASFLTGLLRAAVALAFAG